MLQVYYEHVHAHCGDRDSPMSVDSLPLSPHGAVEKTREVLISTNRATRKVLSCMSNAKWWKKTLGSLRSVKVDVEKEKVDDQNTGITRIGTHPFYESSFSHCYSNTVLPAITLHC